MALQVRRGTNAERLGITPLAGELVYTTDTNQLYVGNGSTTGGNLIDATTELALDGLTDVDIAGAVNGQVLAYNSGTEKWSATDVAAAGGVIEGSNYRINIVADDSTVLVDADNSVLSNGTLTLTSKFIRADGDGVTDELVLDTISTSQHAYGISGNPDNMGYLSIIGFRGTRAAPTTVLANDLIGSFTGRAWNGTIPETKTLITTAIDTVTGTNTLPGKLSLSIHDYNGNYTTFGGLDSRGTFEMPTFRATPYADVTARDTVIITPLAGMIVYITSTNKLQCYNGSSWSDLF